MQWVLGTRQGGRTTMLFQHIKCSYRHIAEGLHAMEQWLLQWSAWSQGYGFWLSHVEIHPHVDVNSFLHVCVRIRSWFSFTMTSVWSFILDWQKKPSFPWFGSSTSKVQEWQWPEKSISRLSFSLTHTHNWNAAEGKSQTKCRKKEGLERRQ